MTNQAAKHPPKQTATMTIPLVDYEELTQRIEDLEDLLDIERARGEQTFPSDVVDRLIDRENPIKVFREHRGIKQNALAAQCEITKSFLSQLERGDKKASVAVYKKLAETLNVDIDDLV